MGRCHLRGLGMAAVAVMSGSLAFAQGHPSTSTEDSSRQSLTKLCKAFRVSESPLDSRRARQCSRGAPRKPLGRADDGVCRDVAEKWSRRLAEMDKAKKRMPAPMAPPRETFDICRDVAEKVAGRPVAVAWCTALISPVDRAFNALPDELWSALDGSPFEGITVQRSRREEALRRVIEHRLAKDWDQVQVKTDLETIGFVCVVGDGVRPPRYRNITTTTAQMTCSIGVS